MPAPEPRKPPSRHMVWYREIVPATVPVILLGTGIFFTLTLLQTHLSHSRSLADSSARISRLEDELADLRASHARQAVTWSAGLGRVVRRVRDLGREVHEFDEGKHHVTAEGPHGEPSSAPAPQAMTLPARLIAVFGTNNAGTSTDDSLTDSAAAHAVDPLAQRAGKKMDRVRETSTRALARATSTATELATDVRSTAEQRLATLPATPETDLQGAIKAAPGGETFAARLLATFGNPRKDAQRTQAEVDRVEHLARETTVDDIASAASDVAHRVEEKLSATTEQIARRIDPLAQRAGEKMDTARETSTRVLERVGESVRDVASDVREEMKHRVSTLPATPETDLQSAIKTAPPPSLAEESLATRLLETFGNPAADTTKTEQEMHDAAAAAQRLSRDVRDVRLEDVTTAVHRAEDKVESTLADLAHDERVKPVIAATSQGINALRRSSEQALEKTSTVVSHVQEEFQQRVATLPPPATSPAAERARSLTADQAVLASRLIATFGSPATDRRVTRQEIGQVVEQGEKLVHKGEEKVMPVVQRVEAVVEDVKERVVDDAGRAKKRWWS